VALRVLLAALFLAASPAWAEDGFCEALRRVVAAAPGDFRDIPEGDHAFPGALRSLRQTEYAPDREHASSFHATLAEHEQTRAQAPRLYRQLRRAIPECLPEAALLRETRVPAQHGILWTLPGAEVEMLLDRPPGAGNYALEIAVLRLR